MQMVNASGLYSSRLCKKTHVFEANLKRNFKVNGPFFDINRRVRGTRKAREYKSRICKLQGCLGANHEVHARTHAVRVYQVLFTL